MMALPPQLAPDPNFPRRQEPDYYVDTLKSSIPSPTGMITGLRKPGQQANIMPLVYSDPYAAVPRSRMTLEQEAVRTRHAQSNVSARSEVSYGILDYYLHSPTDSEPENAETNAIHGFDFGLNSTDETRSVRRGSDNASSRPASQPHQARSGSAQSYFSRTDINPFYHARPMSSGSYKPRAASVPDHAYKPDTTRPHTARPESHQTVTTRASSPTEETETAPRQTSKSFFWRTSKKPQPTPRRRRKAGSSSSNNQDRRGSLSFCCQGPIGSELLSSQQFHLPATSEEPLHQYPDETHYPDKYSLSDSSRSRKDSGTSLTSSQYDLTEKSRRSHGTTSQASSHAMTNTTRCSDSSHSSHSSSSFALHPSLRIDPNEAAELSFEEALAEGDELQRQQSRRTLFSRSSSRKRSFSTAPGSALSSPKSPNSPASSKSSGNFMATMKKWMPWGGAGSKTGFHD